jgi:SAM-dependent methyltransferase
MTTPDDRRAHWQQVWATRDPDAASWHQDHPTTSLSLIEGAGLRRDAGIVDVGGGDSLLVDCLVEGGWVHVAVLDIAPAALARAAERLGPLGDDVTWIESDVLDWHPVPALFEVWHDRACFHFLTDAADRRRYAEIMATALVSGGIAILAEFAPDGPERCSGLAVERSDTDALAALLAPNFELIREFDEDHRTPAGRTQRFRWRIWRRL